MASNDSTTGGHKTQNRQGQYAKFEPLVDISLEKLRTLLDSRNEPTVLGALKIVFERTIPAIKALEIQGKDGEPIKLNLITGADISKYIELSSASTGGSTYRPTPIQSSGVAQESKEDNNSNQPISEVGSV